MAEITRVEEYGDLVGDDDLSLQDADTLAGVLPTDEGRVAIWLPLWLAEEKPLTSAGKSDQVFVAEFGERETEKAYYVRQGNAGVWIPKSVARVYQAPPDADIVSPQAYLSSSTEGSA
jgi:hypothetical protein